MIGHDINLRPDLVRNAQGGPRERLPLAAKRGGVIVHYTGEEPVPEGHDAQMTLLGRYAQYHALTRDWSSAPGHQPGDGIMYHLAVLRSGLLVALRDLEESLWHCGTERNASAFSLLVMVGGGQRATEAQLATARRTCDALLAINGLPRREVRGHLEESATECPGTLMDDLVRPYRAGTLAAPRPLTVDELLERAWRVNRDAVGEKDRAGILADNWGGDKVLVCERALLIAWQDGHVDIARVGNIVDHWQEDGTFQRY